MKTITHGMNLDGQIRKGMEVASNALIQRNFAKASYTMETVKMMIESFDKGEPRPWSEFFSNGVGRI
jgi:hypothetical protein